MLPRAHRAGSGNGGRSLRRARTHPAACRWCPTCRCRLPFSGESLTGAIAIPEAALHGETVRVLGPDDLLELRPVAAAFRAEWSRRHSRGPVARATAW